MDTSYVYILTNTHHNVFYTGVTTNLVKRIFIHKNHVLKGFTQKYNVNKLVYYEKFYDVVDAIQAEKKIKRWKKLWKIQLITQLNPLWEDLFNQFYSGGPA